MAKLLSDNADVLRTKLRTLYNLPLSASSAVALISARKLWYWWPKMPFQSQVKVHAYL